MDIQKILLGIDKTETESPDGWWETSTGAEFGAKKLREVETEIDRLKAFIKEHYPSDYFDLVMEIDRLKEENAVLRTDDYSIRMCLALNHGHKGMYFDDGEIQCGACIPNYDYKRLPLLTVVKVAMGALLSKLSTLTALIESDEAAEKVVNNLNECGCSMCKQQRRIGIHGYSKMLLGVIK